MIWQKSETLNHTNNLLQQMSAREAVWAKRYTILHAAVSNANVLNKCVMGRWEGGMSKSTGYLLERVGTRDSRMTGAREGCGQWGNMSLPCRAGRVVYIQQTGADSVP